MAKATNGGVTILDTLADPAIFCPLYPRATWRMAQLCALERRTARGGRDSIDHAAQGHDDVANAAAGALVVAAQEAHRVPLMLFAGNDDSVSARQAQYEHILATIRREGCWWPGD